MKTKEINLSVSSELIEEQINSLIAYCKEEKLINDNNISDGWHTFDDLYEIRKAYNVVLFNELANPNTIRFHLDKNQFDGTGSTKGNLYKVHKSLRHFDGELCFGGGWFIVVAILPTGQISNHYKLEDWDLFNIPEYDKALFEFDGHTTKDVINRLKQL